MWTGHFHISLVRRPSWNKMMLDLVTSQVTVINSWQLLQAPVQYNVYFPSHLWFLFQKCPLTVTVTETVSLRAKMAKNKL